MIEPHHSTVNKDSAPPLVSVIIPAFNAIEFIGKAIRSAQNQTYQNIEIIIIDDGSTDKTADYVRTFIDADRRIRLVQLPTNSGVSAARNKGLEHAMGAWIAVLDADDQFLAHRIETLLKFAERYNLDMVCDNITEVEYETNKLLGVSFSNEWMLPHKDITLDEFIQRDIPGTYKREMGYIKPVFRRDIIVKNKIWYDEEIFAAEDFLFCVEFLSTGACFRPFPCAMYIHVRRRGSLSSTDKATEGSKLANTKLLNKITQIDCRLYQLLALRMSAVNFQLFIAYSKKLNFLRAFCVAREVPSVFFLSKIIFAVSRRAGIKYANPVQSALSRLRRRYDP